MSSIVPGSTAQHFLHIAKILLVFFTIKIKDLVHTGVVMYSNLTAQCFLLIFLCFLAAQLKKMRGEGLAQPSYCQGVVEV